MAPVVAAALILGAGGAAGAPRVMAQAQPSAASPSKGPTLRFEPPSLALEAEAATVDLVVAGAQATTGFQSDILFDATVVAVTGVELGPWIGSTGRPVQPLGPNLEIPGRLVVGAVTAGDMPAPTGDGVLVRITIAAVAPGESDLILANASLIGADLAPVSPGLEQGRVSVLLGDGANGTGGTSVAAAQTVAAEPRATLAQDFVTAVAADATREAPQRATAAAALASAGAGTAASGRTMATPGATPGPREELRWREPATRSSSGKWLGGLAALTGILVAWAIGRRRAAGSSQEAPPPVPPPSGGGAGAD